MEALWQDFRYAARMVLRSPAFAAVAVLTLGLGIGANTAIFSVVNAVLLRPLPYKDSDRLVRIIQTRPNAPPGIRARLAAMSTEDIQAWRPRTQTLSHIAAYGREVLTLTGREEPVRLNGARVSPALFPMLGAQPVMGRVFEEVEEKPGSDAVVILSYSAWQRYFGFDPDIPGRIILLEGRGYSVIGVMPDKFEFPDRETLFWTPFVLTRSLLAVAEMALALVLLVGAGLLINSFLRLSNVDPGYDPENVLTFQVALPQARYAEAQRLQFYEQMLTQLQALPAVQAAAMANTLPLQAGIMRLSLNIQGICLPRFLK